MYNLHLHIYFTQLKIVNKQWNILYLGQIVKILKWKYTAINFKKEKNKQDVQKV